MTKDLLVRGLDDSIHSELSTVASRQSISINSIVKDAVEKWLQKNDHSWKKHDLILYTDEQSFANLISDIDKLTMVNRFTKIFYGPPNNKFSKIVSQSNWQIYTSEASVDENRTRTINKITKDLRGRKSCCIDFELNEIFQDHGIMHTLALEKKYNSARQASLMYCFYEYKNLIRTEPEQIIKLFEEHDQVFLLQGSGLLKIHISKENVHKLFLN